MGKSKSKGMTITPKKEIEAIFRKAGVKAYEAVHATDDYAEYREAAIFYNEVADALNKVDEQKPVDAVEEEAIQASLVALRESVLGTLGRVVAMLDTEKPYHDAGFPLETPEKEMTDAEARAFWRHKSRLWEGRAKKSAKEVEELRAFKDRLVYRGNRNVEMDVSNLGGYITYKGVDLGGNTVTIYGVGGW